MLKSLLLFLIGFSSYHLSAQEDTTYLPQYNYMAVVQTEGIATGLHVNQYPMLEVGYFKHTVFQFPMTFWGSYTVESYFIDDFVIAPKVNYWVNILGINTGFSIPWYFDIAGKNSLKIRPEVGFGYKSFKVNYS